MQRVITRALFTFVQCVALALLLSTEIIGQQVADPNFNTSVTHPAYTRTHPVVVIDEAHSNFHTAAGRYKPFAELLTSDGYHVVPGTKKVQRGGLQGTRVLLIANARAADATADTSGSAFTEEECGVVRDWVRAGGSLLLIADHAPFGGAVANLAKRFDVEMGKGFVFDLGNSEPSNPTLLVFSRENRLLRDHAIVRGRNPSEEVKRIVAFTGQSLSVPTGAVALMELSATAYESPTGQELQAAIKMDSQGKSTPNKENIAAHAQPVSGHAQGIAMQFGKGRVVVFGEAAMFSAQVVRFKEGEQQQEFKMGMNVPDNDDRQFALNVLHWLSGLLK